MRSPKKISPQKLGVYAAALGKDSDAYAKNQLYLTLVNLGFKPIVRMGNNGFTVTMK